MTRTRSAPWTLLAILLAVAIGGCATIDRTVATDPNAVAPAASPAGEPIDPSSPLQTP